MTQLDLVLQKGPQNGDVAGGLDELRQIVLQDGIPANSDGMVSEPLPNTCHIAQMLTPSPVRTAHIHLARPPQRPSRPNRRLSRPRPPGCLSSLREDPQRHLPYLDY